MAHDPLAIKGYRSLSAEDIAAINALKDVGAGLKELIEQMRAVPDLYDQRWVSIGETHLQQGMMALIRAIAKPEGF